MRLGVLGGAFDPPHRGHLELALRAQEQLGLDRILLVPNAEPPWKPARSDRPSPAARFAMTAALAGSVPGTGIEACDLEVRRGGVSYTIDTLRELGSLHPGARCVLLLGADALEGLPRWREAAELARIADVAVLAREGALAAALPGFRVEALDGPQIPISSTDLRRRLGALDEVQPDLPSSVAAVIESEMLYLPTLPAELSTHVATVSSAGRALASRWNLPVEDVELACRYHDIYRAFPDSELLALARTAGLDVDAYAAAFPLLLHGPLAAVRLARTGPTTPGGRRRAIHDAVRFHTTGRGGMTGVESAVIVADQVGKLWPSVADVPMDAGEAVVAAIRKKLARSGKRGRPAHPLLQAAAADLGLAA